MQATYTPSAVSYPARLEGHLEHPSRWLWLVKWLLLVPHYIVLAILWVVFALLSLIAFFALLFGWSYPRGIFDFNVGVLRWTWRISFYAFNANGTDRYPPFTLADVPDYPARLEIEYPADQRHGLPLIGWWLAGIPQYLVAAIFVGSGTAASWSAGHDSWSWSFGWGGLIGLLVFFAVVVLLFRGEYPRSIFDFVLGLNRWVLRVGAYAALMTREYPPFRLDAGENDPGGLTLAAAAPPTPTPAAPAPAPAAQAEAAPRQAQRWGVGRVIGVILASLGVLAALAAIAAGGTAVVFDQTQRDAAGYLMTRSTSYATGTYAFVSDSYRTGAEHDWVVARDLLGNVRIRSDSSAPVFVGIGRAAAVDSYLAGVRREVATNFGTGRSDFRLRGAVAPSGPPTAQSFWVAQTSGSGTQTLTWTPSSGNWRVVLMNMDGTRDVNANLAAGAEFPHLLWIGIGVLIGGGLLLLLSGGGLYLAVRTRR